MYGQSYNLCVIKREFYKGSMIKTYEFSTRGPEGPEALT